MTPFKKKKNSSRKRIKSIVDIFSHTSRTYWSVSDVMCVVGVTLIA